MKIRLPGKFARLAKGEEEVVSASCLHKKKKRGGTHPHRKKRKREAWSAVLVEGEGRRLVTDFRVTGKKKVRPSGPSGEEKKGGTLNLPRIRERERAVRYAFPGRKRGVSPGGSLGGGSRFNLGATEGNLTSTKKGKRELFCPEFGKKGGGAVLLPYRS